MLIPPRGGVEGGSWRLEAGVVGGGQTFPMQGGLPWTSLLVVP